MGTLASERQLIHLCRLTRVILCCIILSVENSRDYIKETSHKLKKKKLKRKSTHTFQETQIFATKANNKSLRISM